MYKEKIQNWCETCGEESRVVKIPRTLCNKLGGMFWDCKNGHLSRSRKFEVKLVNVG